MNNAMKNLIRMALAEDIGPGDITTELFVPKGQKAKAFIIAKEAGIIAGLPIAMMVYGVLDPKVKFIFKIKDASKVKKGKIIAEISGSARSILTGERLALNFLQRLSGIATLTDKFVARVKGTRAKILDTRKTTPLWRGAEKYAVLAGGGVNHRMGLFDAILIKDNHLKYCKDIRLSGNFEMEAANMPQVKKAIKAGASRILLDNMSVKTLRSAVKLCKPAGVKTEASGGIRLDNVRAVAKAGVDFISIGALTHSARALDLSLKII